MVLQGRQAQREGLGARHDVLHGLELGHVVARLGRHLQAGVVQRQAGAAVAGQFTQHIALAPVVGGQRQVPVVKHLVQAPQVVQRRACGGQHIAPVIAKQVLAQVEVLARAGHELPHAGSLGARHGLRVEGAFDEGQQCQLNRHVALLHFFDDVEEVAAATLGHALHVLGLAGVVLLPFADQVAFDGRHAVAGAHTFPQVQSLGVLPGVQAAARARRWGGFGFWHDLSWRCFNGREGFRRGLWRRGWRHRQWNCCRQRGFDRRQRAASRGCQGANQENGPQRRGPGANGSLSGALHQKWFFHSRRAANTETVSVAVAPRACAAATTVGSVQRRKGLIRRSVARRAGSVGWSVCRSERQVWV